MYIIDFHIFTVIKFLFNLGVRIKYILRYLNFYNISYIDTHNTFKVSYTNTYKILYAYINMFLLIK